MSANAYMHLLVTTYDGVSRHWEYVGEHAMIELVDGAPIRDANGKIIGTVLSFDELTGKISLKIDDVSTIINTK